MPEWYFLPFYAILRAIPNKLLGVIALFSSIARPGVPAVARYLARALGRLPADLPPVLLDLRAHRARPGLSRLAAAGRVATSSLARILTVYYFAHFLIVLPVLGLIEKPKPLPASITESVLAKSGHAAQAGA